jgi:hypothetical protein
MRVDMFESSCMHMCVCVCMHVNMSVWSSVCLRVHACVCMCGGACAMCRFLRFSEYSDELLVHFVGYYWPELLLEKLTVSCAWGKPYMQLVPS